MSPKKRTRRQYGTGSVYQRSSDGRWMGVLQAGWLANGKRRVITVSCTAAKGEAECKRLLREKALEIEREGAPTENLGRLTVKAWSEIWLPMHAQDVRPNTYTTDAGVVRKWIVPTVGHRRLEQLTPGDVRKVHAAVLGAGNGQSAARQAHWTLMGMLKAARQEGHRVPINVTETKAPPKANTDREAIPLHHALTLLEAASQDPGGARWVTAMLGGMRQGERLGLTWDHVDLEAGVTNAAGEWEPRPELDISWQLDTLPYVDKTDRSKGFLVKPGETVRRLSGAYHLTPPKTGRGQRIVPLVPWLATTLAAWREVAPENQWGLVWCDVDQRNGGHRFTPYRDTKDREEWETFQERCGVAHPSGRPYTMHEARNTAVTILFEAGVDPKVITQIVGHSTIATSRSYQTVSRDALREAMEKMSRRLGR